MHGHSCLYAHVYMDMNVYMHVHECVCEHVYGCTSVLACLHVCIDRWVSKQERKNVSF